MIQENTKSHQGEKLYFCSVCKGLGSGNRFVEHHLHNQCSGKQKRRVRESTKRNGHRLHEGIINTKQWKSEKIIFEANRILRAFKSEAVKDIDNMQEINRSIVEDMLKSFYTQIF